MRRLNVIASNSKFVCAENGGGYVGDGSLIANRTNALEWETFTEEKADDGVSIKTYNGNYFTAELDGSISTDRTQRNSWEKWYPVNNGYKSVHGKFMGLAAGGNIRCDSDTQGAPQTFNIVDLNPPIALPELHVSGRYAYDEYGNFVFLKGTTDFMLYKWYLEGKDITPILKQRRDHGCNYVRVIGMVSWFDYPGPSKYGTRYYDEIPAFLDLCASFGLYVYWTVFADTQVLYPKLSEQLTIFNNVVAQLSLRKNRFGELVNEPYTGTNATANPNAFTKPNFMFSSGSYNDKYKGNPSPGPYWWFHDYHSSRSNTNNKYIKDCSPVDNPNYLQLGMAVLIGEPDKFGGPNQYNPEIYRTNPDESRMMYNAALAGALGYNYHTSAGNFSVLWNDIERHCCPFLMAA